MNRKKGVAGLVRSTNSKERGSTASEINDGITGDHGGKCEPVVSWRGLRGLSPFVKIKA